MGGEIGEQCVFCDTKEKETYGHFRFTCAGSRDALTMVPLTIAEELSYAGLTFWFDTMRHVGHVAGSNPTTEVAVRFLTKAAELSQVRILQEGTDKDEGKGKASKMKTTSVFFDERLRSMATYWTPQTVTTEGKAAFWNAAKRLAHRAASVIIVNTQNKPMTARLRPDDPLAIIRQLAPALRKWIRDHVLGPDSGETIQSGLTFTTSIFYKEPSLHIDAFQTLEEKSGWNYGRDDVTNADWATRP